MTIQLNKPVSRTRPSRQTISRDLINNFSSKLPPGLLLGRARQMLGVSRQMLSAEMGMPSSLLRKFEFGQVRMPASFLLKIFMFGLDFWTDGICWLPENEESTPYVPKREYRKK